MRCLRALLGRGVWLCRSGVDAGQAMRIVRQTQTNRAGPAGDPLSVTPCPKPERTGPPTASIATVARNPAGFATDSGVRWASRSPSATASSRSGDRVDILPKSTRPPIGRTIRSHHRSLIAHRLPCPAAPSLRSGRPIAGGVNAAMSHVVPEVIMYKPHCRASVKPGPRHGPGLCPIRGSESPQPMGWPKGAGRTADRRDRERRRNRSRRGLVNPAKPLPSGGG